MTSRLLHIAIAQTASVVGDIDQNIEVMRQYTKKSANENIDLVVFPELNVTGYTARDAFDALADTKTGSVFQRVSEIASYNRVAICFGYPEKEDGVIYNASQLIDERGALLLNHRKTHLYGDYERACFTQGETPVAIAPYRGVNISTLICYEIEFPELARANVKAGAQLILTPTATTNKTNPNMAIHGLVKARATENNVFVAYANHARGEASARFNGRSLITAPLGETESASKTDKAELIKAQLDFNRLSAGAAVLPYLEDLREDLF